MELKNKSDVFSAVISLYSCEGVYPITICYVVDVDNIRYPKPYQILFCKDSTEWEDIELLLYRCFYNNNRFGDPLFCIADVEYLGICTLLKNSFDF